MKRKDFLKGMGIAGIGSFFIKDVVTAGSNSIASPPPSSCTIIPRETEGPYPLDLTDNAFYFRQDVREDRQGVQLNLKMKIIGSDNCLPMPNVRVNIWHCDKDGNYSGYQSEVGKTYLRGHQMTDANGEVEFVTIFPGWYNGRICHIHLQVFVSSVYSAVSQLAFPTDEKNAVYAANSGLYTKGADPLSFNQDNIFSDGYALQLATLTANSTTGGYDSYLEVTVAGEGVSGLREAEPETGGQFKLGQNYPNPFMGTTTIPFTMINPGQVQIEIFNLEGKALGKIVDAKYAAGDHTIILEKQINTQKLSKGNYVYQLSVKNEYGTYRQCKMMMVQ